MTQRLTIGDLTRAAPEAFRAARELVVSDQAEGPLAEKMAACFSSAESFLRAEIAKHNKAHPEHAITLGNFTRAYAIPSLVNEPRDRIVFYAAVTDADGKPLPGEPTISLELHRNGSLHVRYSTTRPNGTTVGSTFQAIDYSGPQHGWVNNSYGNRCSLFSLNISRILPDAAPLRGLSHAHAAPGTLHS